MNKQIFLSHLINIGLEETEASIYLFLLEHGPHTHLELSRETNIDRSKIYRYIEKLEKKKLIEASNNSRGKKIQAANPSNIELLLEEKEEKLKKQKESLPSLIESLSIIPTYRQREFEVKHYRGQDGLKQMLWNQLYAKDKIVAFSYKNKNDIAGKPYADKIRAELIERKIMVYELQNESDKGNYWYSDLKNLNTFYKEREIDPKILEIKQYIAIFNNTVAIMNWLDGEEIGVEIINTTYAEMQRQLFWKFWEISENYIEEGKRIEALKKAKK